MKTAVIYNPVGDREVVDSVREGLASESIDVTWIETVEDDPGRGQTLEAIETGSELIIAVGGDGTIRACADGAAGSNATLGIVPAGTGNLLARNLELPTDPREALDVALRGETVSLDVGVVNGEVFAVIAGAGIDAVIMDDTSRESKDRFGVLAYVLEGAKHVFDHPLVARVSLDDGNELEGRFATVMVGNLGRLQGGVDLFPESTAHDGVIDLLGLSAESPFETLAAAFSVVSGQDNRLIRGQGKRIVATFDKPTPYQLDGEARPEVDRLDFHVNPAALRVRTPRSSQ